MSDEPITDKARAAAIQAVEGRTGDALIEAVAAVVQHYIDCAELAEAERKHAVRARNGLAERIVYAARAEHVEEWLSCPKCGVRAESTLELQHRPDCTLSTWPPPMRPSSRPSNGQED